MALLFLMNLMVIVSAFLVTSRLLGIKNFIDSLMAMFIFYLAQIVLTQLFLGNIHALYLDNLILLNAVILIFIYLSARGKSSSFSCLGIRSVLIGMSRNKVILLGASFLIGFSAVKIAINLVNPPFGWDCLNYHFSFPVEWMKNGSISVMTTIADDPSPPYYPINGSLLFLWFIMPLKNVFMADLGQVPFFVLMFMATYSICRKIGLGRELAFYSAALFLITPNVFKQIEIAYVDVMIAALFLTSINFLISLYRDFSFKNLFLFAATFGLFLGTKTSAVIYGIFPLFFLLAALVRNSRRLRFKGLSLSLLITLSVIILLGGFSYLRNFILTGNALYPAEIKILGKVVFKGVMPFSTYRDKWTGKDFNIEKLLFHEGLGLQFMLLVIPAAFASILLFFKRHRKKSDFVLSYILVLPALLYLSFWMLMPQLWVRYLYPFFGSGFIVASYALDALGIPLNIVRAVVSVCFLASMAELSGHMELIISVVLSAVIFITLPFMLRKARLDIKRVAVILILLFGTLYYLNLDYNKNEFSRYLANAPFPRTEEEAWVWLDTNTRHARIAYTGSPDNFPLYGSNLKNEVVYVSVNATQPVKLHYFPNARYVWTGDFLILHENLGRDGNYREKADYATWVRNLGSEGVGYLVVYALHQVKDPVFPVEDSWAVRHPEVFRLDFSNKRVHIYRLIK